MAGLATNKPRTVIAPLTTTFTPPPRCSIPLWQYPRSAYAPQAQSCTDTSIIDNHYCWPSAAQAVSVPSPPYRGWGFYSPGTICPSGYVSACTATANGRSDWPVEYSMVAGETAVGCCPSGFTCSANGAGQTCQSIAGVKSAFQIARCSGGALQDYFYMTLPYVVSATTTTMSSGSTTATATEGATVFSTFQFVNPMIDIRWQSSDLAVTTTAAMTTATSASTTAAAAADSGSTGAPQSTNHSGSSLSAGAKAAIGIAVAFLALLFVVFVAWWRVRRKRQRQEQKESGTLRAPPSPHAVERTPNEQPPAGVEVQGIPVYEMEQTRKVHEIGPFQSGPNEVHELDGRREIDR